MSKQCLGNNCRLLLTGRKPKMKVLILFSEIFRESGPISYFYFLNIQRLKSKNFMVFHIWFSASEDRYMM